jgi:formate--tetrahydrofolate ligase
MRPLCQYRIGQSSIVADLLATKLGDYHVTESGFGADIGFEKFWNLKCRFSGLRPSAVVVVATIRALKMHGGGPAVKPGVPLSEEYTRENLGLLEKGCENLVAHINTVRKSGVRPVVCVNSFYTDTKAEIELVRRIAERRARRSPITGFAGQGRAGRGGRPARKRGFRFLYETSSPRRRRSRRLPRRSTCPRLPQPAAAEKLQTLKSRNGELAVSASAWSRH